MTPLLILVTLAWGIGFITTKHAVAAVPPLTMIAMRFAFASIILFLVFSFVGHDRFFPLKKGELKAGAILGIFLYACYGFQAVGIQYTTVSHTGFITGLSVVFVPIIAAFLGQKINRFALSGILLSALGTFLLSKTDSLLPNYGDVLVLIAACAVALHIVYVGRYAGSYSVSKITFIQIVTCTLLSIVTAFCFEDLAHYRPDLTVWVWSELFFMGAVATALAFVIQNAAQKYISPVKIALIFTFEPIFAAVFSVWLGLEVLSTQQWTGGGLMLAGVLVAEIGPSLRFRRSVG